MHRAKFLQNPEKETAKELTWDEASSSSRVSPGTSPRWSTRHSSLCHNRLVSALKTLGIDKTPATLTEDDFRRVIVEIKNGVNGNGKKGSSITTVNHVVRAAKQLFTFLETEKLIKRNSRTL